MNLFPVVTDRRVSNERMSQNGLVRLWVAPGMYGYRVQAGFQPARCFIWDWCAGDKWPNVIALYSLAHAILSGRPEDMQCFHGLPEVSRVKPFFLDLEFVGTLYAAAMESQAPITVVPLEQPPDPLMGLVMEQMFER